MTCPRQPAPCPSGYCQGRPGCERFTLAAANLRRAAKSAATGASDARNTYPWALPDLGEEALLDRQEREAWAMYGISQRD